MFLSCFVVKGELVVPMSNKLKISNIVFSNELTINELIDDYSEFIATKLFQERKILDEKG